MKSLYMLTTILLATCFLCACGGRADKRIYAKPEQLQAADDHRKNFVDSFLQGNWCESEALFATSQEYYLRQDNMCDVAQNFRLAWSLKQYISIEDFSLKEQAERYETLGFGCSAGNMPLADISAADSFARATGMTDGTETTGDSTQNVQTATHERDARYRDMLKRKDFDALHAALAAEKDQLFASVYGRRAASRALETGNKEQAATFLQQCRKLDAAQGWVVFLREDWRLAYELAETDTERATIDNRIRELEHFIQPCTTQ